MWSTEPDLRNEMVYNAMRRNRYDNILRGLHFEDRLCTPTVVIDKMWKLRPVIEMVKANMVKHFHPERSLSYDESMIVYFGKHGCKQFIRGKPIRFGYKLWSLCTTSGYMVNFEVYQGKLTKGSTEYDCYGKCAAPLLHLMDTLPEHVQELKFHLFFDNLFTGFPLLMHLRDRGYEATGTIRDNRIPRNCPLMSKKKNEKSSTRDNKIGENG